MLRLVAICAVLGLVCAGFPKELLKRRVETALAERLMERLLENKRSGDLTLVMAKCSLPTEGGRCGPVILLAGFAINIFITGLTRCTGVLFSSFQREFQSSTAQTGAISSIINSTSYFGCFVAGVLCNRFGCRFTAILGGVLCTAGLIGGALTSTIYQIYVGSFVAGLGTGIAVTPPIVATAMYFQKNQTMATGLVMSGIGVGLVSFAPFMQMLLDTYGWRGTLLIIGVVMGNTCVGGAVLRPLRLRKMAANDVIAIKGEDEAMMASGGVETNQNETPVVTRRLDWPFRLLNRLVILLELGLLRRSYRLSVFCLARVNAQNANVSYGTFLVYVIGCAAEAGIDQQRASFIISLVGISGIPGYLLCGFVNKAVSSVVIMMCTLLAYVGAILISLLALYSRSYFVFLLSAAMLGAAAGFQHTILPTIICDFVGRDKLASAFGIYSGFAAVADLLGPIIAGALYDVSESYFVVFGVLTGLPLC